MLVNKALAVGFRRLNKRVFLMVDVRQRYKIGGRPVTFKTAEEVWAKIGEYLDMTANRAVKGVTKSGEEYNITKPAPMTIEGFCAFCGMTKTTFYTYMKKKKFKPVLEQFRQIVESYWVDQCAEGVSGNKADFVLKNGFSDSWKDKNIRELDFADDVKEALVSFVGGDNAED